MVRPKGEGMGPPKGEGMGPPKGEGMGPPKGVPKRGSSPGKSFEKQP